MAEQVNGKTTTIGIMGSLIGAIVVAIALLAINDAGSTRKDINGHKEQPGHAIAMLKIDNIESDVADIKHTQNEITSTQSVIVNVLQSIDRKVTK